MEMLEQAIEQSLAVVVYVGRLGIQHWVDREVRLGLALNTHDPRRFKVIPVLGDGADVAHLPPFLRQHQGISANDPFAIRRLIEALQGEGAPAVPAAYWATHSPFRSLHAFEPEDAWLFFGRDQRRRAGTAWRRPDPGADRRAREACCVPGRLEFRAEASNLLNTTNFGTPAANISNTNAGVITTADDPRNAQLSVRVIW